MRNRRALLGLLPLLALPGRAGAFTLKPASRDDRTAMRLACDQPSADLPGTATAICPFCGCPTYGTADHGEQQQP